MSVESQENYIGILGLINVSKYLAYLYSGVLSKEMTGCLILKHYFGLITLLS